MLSGKSLIVVLIFICNFSLVKQYIVSIHNGLAISLYYYGLIHKKSFKHLTVYLAPLTHISFFIVIFFHYVERILSKKFTFTLSIIVFLIMILSISIILPLYAYYTNDYRLSEYSFKYPENTTCLNQLYWFLIFIFALLYSSKNEFSRLLMYGIAFYIISLPFLDFSMRVFASFLPCAIISIKDYNGKPRQLYALIMIIYGLGLWYTQRTLLT